jgi:alanine-synthesizing transaminase
MNFSERTNWNLAENELTAAIRQRRASGRDSSTSPSPTQPTADSPTMQPRCSRPSTIPSAPLRTRSARHDHRSRSSRALLQRRWSKHPADRICLTTSTSEAYSFLFRLLCNPGDEVLVASPSYPLFDYIAKLDDVRLREYPLFYDPNADLASGQGWSIDLHALEASITTSTRAIIVVHPNNPTGNFASPHERAALETLCAKRNLALIVDEVFLDYALSTPQPSFATGESPCLTFVLSGISKVCGLPQMKASWIATRGPRSLVARSHAAHRDHRRHVPLDERPIQHALPTWLATRHAIQQQIHDRMRTNLALLDSHLQGTTIQRLALQAGWTAILRVPRTISGREFVQAALDRGVLVQPGDFYGLGDARAVVSLLTPPEAWAAGLNLLPTTVN